MVMLGLGENFSEVGKYEFPKQLALHTSVRHILRPCRRCLVWQPEEDAMVYPPPASVSFKRRWDAAAKGVPYSISVANT